ncbi:MAG: hypothetical protein IGR92_15645 [Leptolyngbyaceae cyanobacterium T60_A2020_046]|nr:hypothetical protein [Leptolyngbyaceae cyanobacterium T60_A2020_046]
MTRTRLGRRWLRWLGAVGLAIATLVLAIACQPQPSVDEAAPPALSETSVLLNGTGADFPFFIYQRWFIAIFIITRHSSSNE